MLPRNLPSSREQYAVNSRSRVGSLERTTPEPATFTEWELPVSSPPGSEPVTGDTTNSYTVMTPSVMIQGTLEIGTAMASDFVVHVLRNGSLAIAGGAFTVPAGQTIATEVAAAEFSTNGPDALSVTIDDDGGGGFDWMTLKLLFRSGYGFHQP